MNMFTHVFSEHLYCCLPLPLHLSVYFLSCSIYPSQFKLSLSFPTMPLSQHLCSPTACILELHPCCSPFYFSGFHGYCRLYMLTCKDSELRSTEWVKELRFLYWHIELQITHSVSYMAMVDKYHAKLSLHIQFMTEDKIEGGKWFDIYGHVEPTLGYV